ncbi:hypothetical protein ACLMJK_004514 [Lecanora helva]
MTFLQFYHQKLKEADTYPNARHILTPSDSWPIAEPRSPTTKFTTMGCGPSRPSRSIYSEYYVEKPNKKAAKRGQQQQRPGPPRKQLHPVPQPKNGFKRPVPPAEVSFMEAKWERDRQMHNQMMQKRKAEMDRNTFNKNAQIRGTQVFF